MFKRISINEAKTMMEEQNALVVDIRDTQSFNNGHIPGAIMLNNDNVQQFVAQADKSKPVLVCCYHGNSSQQAADFLNNQGFAESCSIDGGYESWKLQYDSETGGN